MIIYYYKKLSKRKILNYLEENDLSFSPPLSSRLILKEYSKKLCENAMHFCAFENEMLVGFVACYFNDYKSLRGYISSFSVRTNYRNQGIGTQLLSNALEYGRKKGFITINLEVNASNISAFGFYKKMGFSRLEQNGEYILMSLLLK